TRARATKGQSDELAQPKKALEELRKQQAELARQLEALNAGKSWRAAKGDGDDDDDADASPVRRLPLNVLRRARDTKPEAAEGKTKKSATRAFTFDGENLFKMDGKLLDTDGGAFTFDMGKGGEWLTKKGDAGGWKVLRAGEGEDAKVFHVEGGEGAYVFRADGEEGGKVLWVGPGGEWKSKVIAPGAMRLAPGVKVVRDSDGQVYRVEVESKDANDDADDDASETKKGSSKKTRKEEAIDEEPTRWRAVRQGESQPLKLHKVEGQPIEVHKVETVRGKRKIVV
ncbi:MAG: hypothetical protein K8I02_01415, partial [Candidatus Methylomirabilis sp.]|nr:hypothetical protein [Deltaproteobacteria bacterium]